MYTKVGFICVLFLSVSSIKAFATFLPENNLYLQDNIRENENMTEAEFNGIIDEIADIYQPIIASHKAELQISKFWSDSTVNATASQSGAIWKLKMYGGLARRPEITNDGFAVVVCHELGHHLGGFAYYDDKEWAASEGQADYFSTHACLPLLWKNQSIENAKYRSNVSQYAKERCDVAWKGVDVQNLCYRVNTAAESIARLFAMLNMTGRPHFETPDLSQTPSTLTSHPATQCRLDTYLAGSLCVQAFDNKLIPARNQPEGQMSVAAEEISTKTTCHSAKGFGLGIRPRCWYAPNLEFKAVKLKNFTAKEIIGNNDGIIDPGEKIEVNIEVGNDQADQITGDIYGHIYSFDKIIDIKNNRSRFPDLQPSETAYNINPLFIEVSRQAECGTTFEINTAVSSALGNIEAKQNFLIGKFVDADIGFVSENSQIPDNDRLGISSSIVSDQVFSVPSAIVHLDITHQHPEDLFVKLETPKGQIYSIINRKGASGANINRDFTVPVNLVSAKGLWKLTVSDLSKQDFGVLNSWSVKTLKAKCSL